MILNENYYLYEGFVKFREIKEMRKEKILNIKKNDIFLRLPRKKMIIRY